MPCLHAPRSHPSLHHRSPGRHPVDTGDLQLSRATDQRHALLPGLLGSGDRLVPARGDRSGGGVPVRGVDGFSGGAGHEDVGFRAVLHPVPAHLQV